MSFSDVVEAIKAFLKKSKKFNCYCSSIYGRTSVEICMRLQTAQAEEQSGDLKILLQHH